MDWDYIFSKVKNLMTTIKISKKPIKEFEKYSVDILGTIFSENYHREGYCRSIKQSFDKDGYSRVFLRKNGKYHTKKVHRLVAQAFIDNPNNKPQINHLDGNKKNNSVVNLEWCTQGENEEHKYRVLKIKHPQKGKFGILNKSSKKVIQYTLENKFVKIWDCILDVKRNLKIDNSSIVKVCKLKYKSAGGFIWRYNKRIESGEYNGS